MTGVHVTSRPFPGHEPLPPTDLAELAGKALAAARGSLEFVPDPCPPGCRCSTWCRDDWVYAEHGAPSLGHCVVCNERARSIDSEGNVRHPTCPMPGATSGIVGSTDAQ